VPESESLFEAVDVLLARPDDLPPPEERARLRKAARLTQQQVADALQVKRETIWTWEKGRTEPRTPQREAYAHLLRGLAARFGSPAPLADSAAPAEEQAAVDGDHVARPGPPDLAGDGSPVQGPPEPCVLCGRPTPYRSGGRPQHLGDFCRTAAPAPAPPATLAAPQAPPAEPVAEELAPAETAGPPVPAARPVDRAVSRPTSSRPAARARGRQGAAADDRAPEEEPTEAPPRHPAGPLAVLEPAPTGSHLIAYLTDGRFVDVPATSLTEVADWALTAGLGSARLHRHGKDGDPLVVLTDAAAGLLGLPPAGPSRTDFSRLTSRLPEGHKVVKALGKAGWLLTKRGLGPWARIYRTPEGGRRECVQFCVPMWGALSTGGWAVPDGLSGRQLAKLLGAYATRVLTPRGSTAVSGLELMTSLRPPTRAVRDAGTGTWTSGPVAGSLTEAVDPAPPEAPAEHPVAVGRDEADVLDEEAWDWHRPRELVGQEEEAQPYVVGVDINTAFLAAAGRLTVGLSEPVHELNPAFDRKVPGCWLVDLSGLTLDPRLPNPFTPTGEPPAGPAWYATPTVAYAVELGAVVRPLEGWLRHRSGPYLDPWHTRLRDAYLLTMERLGVTPELAERHPQGLLDAMARVRESGDPVELAVLAAIKATAKGGIGKLRERPQGAGYRPGQPWPALDRPTWRPDIRAAVIATARINMHRKLLRTAAATGSYPLAVLSDCAVYAAPAPSALDVLPYGPDGKPVAGALRLGISPGHVKFEGSQEMRWLLELLDEGTNPARHIKAGTDAHLEGE